MILLLNDYNSRWGGVFILSFMAPNCRSYFLLNHIKSDDHYINDELIVPTQISPGEEERFVLNHPPCTSPT